MEFVVFIIIAAVAGMLIMFKLVDREEAMWREIAKRLEGEFRLPDNPMGYPMVVLPLGIGDGRELIVTKEVIGNQSAIDPIVVTHARVKVPNPHTLNIHSERTLSRGRFGHEAQIGWPKYDAVFTISCSDPLWTRVLLAQCPDLLKLHLKHQILQIELHQGVLTVRHNRLIGEHGYFDDLLLLTRAFAQRLTEVPDHIETPKHLEGGLSLVEDRGLKGALSACGAQSGALSSSDSD